MVGHHFVLGDERPHAVAGAEAHRAAIPAFATALELDDAQVAAVEAILSRHQAVVTDAWATLHARLQTSADSAHGEIESLLSAEQRDKFAEWRNRRLSPDPQGESSP